MKRWWDDLPVWLLWRAQIFQESRCNTLAKSAVGAEGLAQIMPRTAADLARKLQLDPMTSPRTARFAIPAGAAYMRDLRRTWSGRARRPLDAHWLAAASYNAGAGSILKAQALCSNALLWSDIAPCLQDVTGDRFSAETIGYIAHIQRYWVQMEKAP